MKVTVEIAKDKAAFFLELVRNLSFVKKVETAEDTSKEDVLRGIDTAVKELKQIKAGKLKGKPVQQLLDEL